MKNKNYYIYHLYYLIRHKIPYDLLGDERYSLKEIYRNINNPKILNEKIQWLKLDEKNNFHTTYADKVISLDYWVEKKVNLNI